MDKSRYETEILADTHVAAPSEPGQRLAWFIDDTFQRIESVGALPCPTYLAVFVRPGIKVGIGESPGPDGREAAVCSMLDANKGEKVEAAAVFAEILYLDAQPSDEDKAIIAAEGLRGLPEERRKVGLLVWVGRAYGGKRTVEALRYELVRGEKGTVINRTPVVFDETTERGRKYLERFKVFEPLIDSTAGKSLEQDQEILG